ncbi:anhydro-N-acetylmuramic acid kinase [Pedobacter montanisoli]|uniref:Anhydro-N-acetylmuramic acid kinase n=1 Tax=Pedobacter montanisoli TaxID=2923277 RepID=A0ABS9ZUJ3_9SPHI|nr:anhydro-N-acetylmuramic acid kinase [Pedobacter montanisoli]MCJ0741892.1 anhydro-N-acetylmuramic acid kinase [Pedobacter montanisoli]
MLNQVALLYHKAQKEEKLIIGLMSGTSMDGLDIALCSFKGSGTSTQIRLLEFKTADYTDLFRQRVKSIFSKQTVDLQMVCIMNEEIAITHAELINNAIREWGYKNEDIDFIASHGQTIFHAPKLLHQISDLPNATLQIGDGDHIAVKTGIITIADFRQKHIAAGGEGAPLAVYGDYLIFSKKGEDRIMLNIGGIANYTFLPGDLNASKVFSTDVGPGNTLMDQYIQNHFEGLYYDKDAAIAKQGKLSQALLEELMQNSFFEGAFPKTTGPELFSLEYLNKAQIQSNTEDLSKEDVMATLVHFSAATIAEAILREANQWASFNIYMSGGGMHNPYLVEQLKRLIPNGVFKTTKDLEINPDAKEAVLFALLANETVSGNSAVNLGKEGVPPVFMGKICLPK